MDALLDTLWRWALFVVPLCLALLIWRQVR